jgi:hypothetical protein
MFVPNDHDKTYDYNKENLPPALAKGVCRSTNKPFQLTPPLPMETRKL